MVHRDSDVMPSYLSRCEDRNRDVSYSGLASKKKSLPIPVIHPLTEQFYWRLGTIHFASWHVQIINKHNLQSQQKQITQGTSCDHDREGNKVLSVRAHLKSGGSVAEWSARRTRNPAVPGSSPALATCWICVLSSRVQILGHACK